MGTTLVAKTWVKFVQHYLPSHGPHDPPIHRVSLWVSSTDSSKICREIHARKMCLRPPSSGQCYIMEGYRTSTDATDVEHCDGNDVHDISFSDNILVLYLATTLLSRTIIPVVSSQSRETLYSPTVRRPSVQKWIVASYRNASAPFPNVTNVAPSKWMKVCQGMDESTPRSRQRDRKLSLNADSRAPMFRDANIQTLTGHNDLQVLTWVSVGH